MEEKIAPSLEQLAEELRKEQNKNNLKRIARDTVFFLLVVAAVVILSAVLFWPVLEIEGSSMENTFFDGDVVVVRKNSIYEAGDMVAFYYNNEILVKRVIGMPGDSITIDDEGSVIVNGTEIEEPYIKEKALGVCTVTFPYEIPPGEIFVLGDNRSVSIDSRSETLGSIKQNVVLGKIVLRVWPWIR